MLKVAVIGHGYWGKNIARNFAQSEDFSLEVICDVSEEALKKAKLLYPGVRVIKDYKQMPEDIDIVAPIVKVDSHYEIANYFLDQKKHVLLTKPFTKTYDEAKKLIAKADRLGLTVFADHTFIFNPAVRKLKELLPKVGDPYLVMSSRLNLGLYQPDVNVIYDLMPHDMSIIHYIFDTDIKKANSAAFHASGFPQEDFAQTNFEFENGLRAFVTVSWLSPYKIRDFIIIGDKGMLTYDDNQVGEKVKFYDKGVDSIKKPDAQDLAYTSRISYRSGDLYAPAITNTEALSCEFSEFLKSIYDKKTRDYYNNITLQTMKSLEMAVEAVGSNPSDSKKEAA
jgi:predicted dehydrogenase